MKRTFTTPSIFTTRILVLASMLLLAASTTSLHAQNVNVNPGAGSYATLKDAFDAINLGTHTGAITVDIVGNTTEVASAVLNASGTGASSYTSILISPSGGAARTISGAIAAGSPMVDLNGADNVTINGLNTGGNTLTISNTTVSATSGTSTIRLQGDASNNLITNCSVQGSATMAVGTNGGNIWFGSAAVTTGNDNNTVSNCLIGPAGANLPTKGIYFSGSSNTDPGTANSGIVINNNEIFDYFSATVSTAGIDLNSGTIGTTISNNKFYQTAIRTMTTTSLTHSGIRISNTSGNNYQITGNTIGYATGSGTGIYTLVFPASTSGGFIPINLSVGTTTATSVQNNTITSIAMSGSASGTSSSSQFRGIYVGSGLTTIGDITGNTIGSQSAVGSITYTSTSASTSDVIGMFNFGSSNWTTNNNTVGGITASNTSTGAANVYGLRCNTSSSATWICNDNTVGGTIANSMQSTTTATGTIVQGILNSSPAGTFTRNTVRNLTAAGGTGTTTSASVVGICMAASSANHTIAQNTISSLTNTNATAATVVTGIQFTGSTANTVERNNIYGLTTSTNSATAEVNGIRVGGGTTTYRNNMIAIGAGIANAIGSAATNAGTSGVNGINGVLGTDNFFHNSVYIGGSPTAGVGASYAFNGVQTTNVRSFRDNIFFNARNNSGATGKNYAIKINGTVANPAGLTINNNIYFANGGGATFGFFNSLDVANIAAWRTAVGQDAASFEGNPQYNDPANAVPDLHIHPTNVTIAEGNGADVGVTNDFDNQVRASFTPVDIGADAGNFVGIDLSAPVITYTPFINTSLTTNRVLAVTITDVTGVATAGLAPRIYYNKNNGAWFSTAAVLASGTVLNGVWNATIDYALVGGVVATDVIRYYVVAQDVLGNLGANPSAGFTGVDVNTVTTPPTTPNQYTIVQAFTGAINVGTAQTYTSLTNAGGIFEAINAGALTGNVTLNITSDLAGELGTNALNQWAEDGVGNYTMLIRPSGAPRTITGTNAGALIRLNGADRVTIDGSTAGASAAACLIGGNAAIRELTIQNTNTGTSAAVISIQTGTNGAQNNTIKNVNVLGQDPTTTLLGISIGGNTPGTVGADNDNNRVENCSFKKSIFGIYAAGASLANQNTGTVITKNDLSFTLTDRIRRIGIVCFNDNGIQITENSLGGIETNESFDAVAIGLGTQGIDVTGTTSGGVTNALVSKNKINGVASLSTTGFSAAGIAVAGAVGGANTLQNNMITGVTAPATSPDLVAGIFIAGVTGSDTRLYYNSVSMTGDRGTVASQTPSYALAITGTDPTVELKNNIFYTTQIASGGGVNAKSYAIGMVSSTFVNLNSNYNDFWSTGANDGGFRTGSLGAAAGTDYANLAAWAAAVTDDANSLEVDPLFVNQLSDLHITNAALNCAGTFIPSVLDDYDCETRSNVTPTIGADNVPLNFIADITVPGGKTICNGVTATLTASPASGVTYAWSTLATTASIMVTPAATTTYTVTVTNGSCATSTSVTITVNPSPTAAISIAETSGVAPPNNGITCAGATVTLTATGGGTYLWSVGAFTTAAILVAPLATTTYTVTVTNANNCTATAAVTITVNPLPTAGITIAETSGSMNDDGSICNGASVILTGTGGTSYSWSTLATTTAITVTPTMTTTYTVTVTNANNCTATTSTTITVNPIPTASITVSPNDTICSGTSAMLTASGGASYKWSNTETTATITVSPLSQTTYTVTVTSAAGCTASTSFTIYINSAPILSAVLTQPSTCAAADGAINLSPSGASSYNWATSGGSGLVAGQEDQSGLTVGTYFVTVTNFSGCTATATYALSGPGGCDVCPTIPTLTTNPLSPVCQDATVGLTASGLTSMGVTYGIIFKHFAAATATPYVGGTVIATVPNGSLTGAGTTATTSTSFAASGTYFIYAVLTPTPTDLSCRPSATSTLVVNPTPNAVATPASQTICSAAAITAIVLSGNVPNTTFNWTRDNNVTVTGIAANGSGNISGSLTNTTSAPITVTFTITPTANGCPGASITATVLVNPTPNAVATPASQTVCSGVAITTIALSGDVAGTTYNWSRDNNATVTGIAANGAGNISGTLTNTTSAAITVTFTITPTANGCPGAPITATVLVNPTPNAVATPAAQTICSGAAITTIVLSGNVAGTAYNWTRDNVATVTGIAANGAGNISGSLTNTTSAPITVTFTITPTANGCPGAAIIATVIVNPTPNAVATPASQTVCSGVAITTIVLSGNVAGTTYNWVRDNNATVTGIAANGAGNISGTLTNTTAAPITVTFTITPTANGCPGAAITATVLVNPTPNAVATPAAQTICSGATITTIVLSGNVANTTFNWTRNNTALVTGIAAAGAGNISGALTNTTNAPITVTFTITPTANGCPGVAITATVLVNPVPLVFALTGGGQVCTTDVIGVNVGLSGSQTNVNYQLRLNGNAVGAPVAGTGAAISFGPQLAGTYTVLATHAQGGCTAVMTGSALVSNFNCLPSISDPCVCLNNATTLFNGQFGEQIKVNAPAGQVWTVTAVNGLYLQLSPQPPTNPFPIPVGTVLVNMGTMFTLDGRHIDAIGYTVSVSNGRGTTFTIGNTCEYPNPSITTVFPAEICLFSDPIPLVGNPGDANIVSQVFTVNGVQTNTFDPSQGTGAYTIVYTVNGGVPKAFGPNDPGCIQSVSTFVNVVVTPTNLVCNDQVTLSLEADCTKSIFPDDVLEGSYLCYDDYIVEVDKNIPFGNGPWFPADFNASDIGKNYQVRVTHLVSGNKCWGNLKVEDKLAPTLSCENFSIPCNTPNVTPAYLQNTLEIASAIPFTFDCQAIDLTYIDIEQDQNCITGLSKTIERTWTAVDLSGNSSTCLQIISLFRPTLGDVVPPPDYDDIDAPSFSCEDNLPRINGRANPTPQWIESQGLQGYPNVFGQPSGCTINWTYTDYPIYVCDGTIKYRREWTIVDWCAGDGFLYNQILKVLDESGPNISCPANLTVSTDPFACCATINLPDVIVEDNCSRIGLISGMIATFDPETGAPTGMLPIGGSLQDFPGNNWWDLDTLANFGWTSCLPIGNQLVTYIAKDDCGNTSSCTFRLIVRDLVPPVASCDETTTVAIGSDDPFDCYGPAGPNGLPLAQDACEFAGVTWVKASVFNDGSADNCNNLRFTIRRMAPYSDCINSLNTVRGFAPCDATNPTFPTESERATLEQDSIKFYCCEVGTTQTIILAAYQVDLNGNIMIGIDGEPIKNECMIQVEVQDKLKPACLPPAQVTVNCENFDPSLWVYGKAQVTDNCCLDTNKVYQGQCGLSHSVNYSLFDTVCNKGTITRTFRAFDCHGFSSSCTQRVIVNYSQDYYIKFPNDAIVTVCDGTGVYGEPFFFGEDCELLGVSFEDEVFTVVPDACFKIERTWNIINWCTFNPNGTCINVPNPNPNAITNHITNLAGPTVSAPGTLPPWRSTVVKINPTDPLPGTDFSTFWGDVSTNGVPNTAPDGNNEEVNCYTYKQIIKIIDGQAPTGTYVVPDCSNQNWFTANRGDLWNESYWWDNGLQIHDLCEEPTDLCITGTDACSGSNINIEYLLFLDLDGNGTMETVINSVNTGIAGYGWNNVPYNNANNPNFSGGTPSAFDERPVPFNQKWGFAIQETIVGNNKTACVRWNTQQQQNTYVVPELPHGTHKIKWFITDGCGNNKEYEYTFTVKDCKAPTVVCLNGLSVNIMPTGMIPMWASDFLQYTEDNCTPNPLKISIRKCGTGTGFPVDAFGNPILQVTFTCAELGTQCVELWAIDAEGNADYCETYVIVQDNLGNCAPGNNIVVSGALKTELSEGIEEAVVNLFSATGDLTDNQGVYNFNNVPIASTFTIAPEKDDNPLNGVTTYDLVLISKHILGIEPLNTPYKMIAADANKSGSITTFDIVEIRKLILGIYTELPNNTSWRFVDKVFAFPSPVNPFQTVFPEWITIANAMVNQVNQDFVGVKIGDVNNTVVANATMQAEERTTGTAIFDLEDRNVKAGEEFEVTFKSAQQLKGFQFTATLNGLKAISTVDGENVTSSNFNLSPENAMAISIDGAQSFIVRFRAEKSGKLSEMLGVSGSITRAEAYTADVEINQPVNQSTNQPVTRMGIAFRFDGKTIAGVGFELYQNQPNPFVNRTFVGFFLPEAAEATLSVFDESGRVVYQQKGQFAKGENTIALDRALINTTGLLYYKLETSTDSATKKMIQAK